MTDDKEGLSRTQEEQAIERQYREREIAVKEAEQKIKEQDLALRRDEARRSRLGSPLVIAIFTAAAAAAGNAIVALVNGLQGQQLESARGEAALILEMIKTGDPEKAAVNLRFLLDTGLIRDPERREALRIGLAKPQVPGIGPFLPGPAPTPAPVPLPPRVRPSSN
jgi:hypothetical protein